MDFMRINFVVLGILIHILYSCKGYNINDIIDKLNTKDLSVFNGFSIHYRSSGSKWNTNIYFVSVNNLHCSPYIIEVNMFNPYDIKINNELVLKSCHQDYLDEEIIKKIMIEYLDLHICVIMVDDYGNVYINPTEQAPPTLLKKKSDSTHINVTEFIYYRDDWYVRKKSE
jgi:hypothetical protein